MKNIQNQPLYDGLRKALSTGPGWQNLTANIDVSRNNYTRAGFFLNFAMAPRWFKSATTHLVLDANLDPFGALQNWSMGQAARLLILLELAALVDANEYTAAISELFKTADVNELIVLVKSLQFIPDGEIFVERAREAARSNIESVFCAVAHHTDYPQRYFDAAGWNQLVLKAAFLAVPIWSIVGVRERNNSALVAMLQDYARERQAASRPVPWDLYCCPAWNASSDADFQFLEHQSAISSPKIRAAIVLGLRENNLPKAQTLAAQLPDQPSNTLRWEDLAAWDN
ncbi:EboA domain-containing protein [Teredinibacter turnerae]|uniref:EboA domain-containing protein n=1 Tax=Teredinibacter turnerae TaxID=2426 RepID=UPI00041311B5|nr:EboA domain-containing protein [Teredinibacter turnerae]